MNGVGRRDLSEPDERAEHDREALLAIHEEERQAHHGLDAELLFRHSAETWTYVHDGRVEEVSRSELIERFRTSFGRTHYDEWEDIEPPRIEISEDGTLAVMVNRVGIRLTRTRDDGSTEELHGVYAGATVCCKMAAAGGASSTSRPLTRAETIVVDRGREPRAEDVAQPPRG